MERTKIWWQLVGFAFAFSLKTKRDPIAGARGQHDAVELLLLMTKEGTARETDQNDCADKVFCEGLIPPGLTFLH
ncbi:hypothetical protein [Brevundimonas sp. SL130]|uniref:hypothetical protein n=1 Tax=Brevundimonas sp. SL130 TaxID=2995143 RepID=UPI00226C64DA|nr:hypothetical protein [Brevundimonas sp. SL130]WAC59133.1 hypothetical protein OU998_13030 [Brevundimonas sp. SL130]